jgi:hypothetical protein
LQNNNPYAVTTSEPFQANARFPIPARSNQAKLCFFLVCLALPLLVVGTATAFYNIFTIVFSGPIMLGFGVAFLVLTRASVLPRFRWFAWICLVFPMGIFLLIFCFSWSPAQAQTPVSFIIALVAGATAISLVGSLVAHRNETLNDEQHRILIDSEMSPHSGDQPSANQRNVTQQLGQPSPARSAEAPNPFTTSSGP